MGHRGLTAAIALGLLAVGGCRAIRATPPVGPHAEGEPPVAVDRPPPTVHVEMVGPPLATMRDPRWIDGQWSFRGRADAAGEGRWVWEPGCWIDWPRRKAWYAPPVVSVIVGGQVWWKAGRIVDPDAPGGRPPGPACAPPAASSAPVTVPATSNAPPAAAPRSP